MADSKGKEGKSGTTNEAGIKTREARQRADADGAMKPSFYYEFSFGRCWISLTRREESRNGRGRKEEKKKS